MLSLLHLHHTESLCEVFECPEINDLLSWFNEFVLVDAVVAEVVDERYASQDAALSSAAYPDHLTVDSDHFRQPNNKFKLYALHWNPVNRPAVLSTNN